MPRNGNAPPAGTGGAFDRKAGARLLDLDSLDERQAQTLQVRFALPMPRARAVAALAFGGRHERR